MSPDSAVAPAASATDGRRDDVLVRLKDVRVAYPTRHGLLSRRGPEIVAVEKVSLEIRRGQTLGIVGGTGAGKSTIARLVMGMVRPTAGTVEVFGHDLARVRGADRRMVERRRQVVLQDPFASLNPRMRVADIVAEPLVLSGWTERAQIRQRVTELLELVGLPAARADAYPHQFSGGQRQRISIARALAPNPQLVVLDEPTSALDVSVRAQILTLLRTVQRQLGLTYLVISHDLMSVAYLSSTVAVMRRGRILEIGPTRALYQAPRHPYTVRLLASVPGQTADFLNQPGIDAGGQDDVPSRGCPYAGHCAMRTFLGSPAQCAREDPELRSVGPAHAAACHFPDQTPRYLSFEHPSLVPGDSATG